MDVLKRMFQKNDDNNGQPKAENSEYADENFLKWFN